MSTLVAHAEMCVPPLPMAPQCAILALARLSAMLDLLCVEDCARICKQTLTTVVHVVIHAVQLGLQVLHVLLVNAQEIAHLDTILLLETILHAMLLHALLIPMAHLSANVHLAMLDH